MHAETGKHSKLLFAMNDSEGEWDTLQQSFVFVTIPRIWDVFILKYLHKSTYIRLAKNGIIVKSHDAIGKNVK